MCVFLVWMRGRPVRLLLAAFVGSLIAGVFCTTAGLAAPLATTAGSSGANVIVSPRPADCAADDAAQAQLISSEPMPCARMLVIARWAAISDQRRVALIQPVDRSPDAKAAMAKAKGIVKPTNPK